MFGSKQTGACRPGKTGFHTVIRQAVATPITRLSLALPGVNSPVVSHDTTRPLWQGDARNSCVLAVLVWVITVLMIIPEGFEYEAVARSGSSITRLLWLGTFGCSVAVLAWRAKLAWLVLRNLNRYLLAFLVLATVSLAWSINPVYTAKRLIRLFEIMAAATAFACVGWHRQRFQNILRPIITLMLAGSIGFGLMFPELAIHQSDSPELHDAWHGLATQKNGFGTLAGIGLIFWFHAWLSREVRLLQALAGGVLAVACLLLSRSLTSMLAVAFAALLMLVMLRTSPNLRRYMPFVALSFIAVLLVYSIAVLRLVPGLGILLSPISTLTGKDLTFSHREQIWTIVTEHIQLNPWLGGGYGAYWNGPEASSPSIVFLARMYFYPNSAHNGYLDLANDLGGIGLLCLAGYLIVYLRQSMVLFRYDPRQGTLFLGLFLQQAITNLSESRWLSVVCLDFLIMTLATVALARALLELKFRQYFGEPAAAPQSAAIRLVPVAGTAPGCGRPPAA